MYWGCLVSRADPTEDVLAAIASVLNEPRLSDPRHDPEVTPVSIEPAENYQQVTIRDSRSFAPSRIADSTAKVASTAVTLAPDDVNDADPTRYERFGPGPLDALRFCWRARCDEHGEYFVDETIGVTSRPISTGPMPRAQVIPFIDARAADSFQRYEDLKAEMVQRQQVIEHDPNEARGHADERRSLPDLGRG